MRKVVLSMVAVVVALLTTFVAPAQATNRLPQVEISRAARGRLEYSIERRTKLKGVRVVDLNRTIGGYSATLRAGNGSHAHVDQIIIRKGKNGQDYVRIPRKVSGCVGPRDNVVTHGATFHHGD